MNEEEINNDIFEKELIENLDKARYWLKYYIDKTKQLENELEYYKNAYENRVDEFINRDRWE